MFAAAAAAAQARNRGAKSECLRPAWETKKRHVQKKTRLPTKTFGNCLLGLHCSQKAWAASRASASFPRVARPQHREFINRLSTASLAVEGWQQERMEVTKLGWILRHFDGILTIREINPAHILNEANGHQPTGPSVAQKSLDFTLKCAHAHFITTPAMRKDPAHQ